MIPLFKPLMDELEVKAIKKTIESGRINEGEQTREFEMQVAKRCGREYGIAVTSGTIALSIACKFEAYYITYVPDYCVISPYNAVRSIGKVAELVDIDKETLCNKKLEHMGNNIFVHFNNHKCKIVGQVIHDISHCIGTDFSDIDGTLCISFSAPKTLTTGQGGMILTNNKHLANEIRRYKSHGRLNSQDEMKDFGGNFKYNDILASIGIEQMRKLDFMLNAKQEINHTYKKHIKVHNPDIPWLVVYSTKNAHNLAKYLNENEIDAQCLYKPIHRLIGSVKDSYENSDWAWNNLVYLPSFVGLTKEDIKNICDKVVEYESQNS